MPQTLDGWLKRQKAAHLVGLVYDPTKREYTATVHVVKTLKVPAKVLVTPDDEDRYVRQGPRKHLILPGMDDGESSETSMGGSTDREDGESDRASG